MTGPQGETPPGKEPERDPPEGSGNAGLIGVLFAVVLVLGAIYLVQRMRHWAAMGDCAFTHAPACRELLEK